MTTILLPGGFYKERDVFCSICENGIMHWQGEESHSWICTFCGHRRVEEIDVYERLGGPDEDYSWPPKTKTVRKEASMKISILQLSVLVQQIITYLAVYGKVNAVEFRFAGDSVELVFDRGDHGDVIAVDRTGGVNLTRKNYAD
jgi:hypothetical protein